MAIGSDALELYETPCRPRPREHAAASLPPHRLVHAVLFSALISAQFFLRALPAVADDPAVALQLFAYLMARGFIFVIPFLAFVGLVQARVAPGTRRWLLFAAALVVLVGLNAAFALWATVGQFTVVHGLATHAGLAMENAWTFAVFGCLVIWYYESADRATRAIAALREHQLAHRRAERWVVEMRLRTLQARLDPRLLFETLDRAAQLYRAGSSAAEALINDLIDYLRKALPTMRETGSTVGREIGLAIAFGRLIAGTRGPVVRAFVDPAVADAHFPPRALQSLCETLVQSAASGGPDRMIRIDALRRGGETQVIATISPYSLGARRLDEARRAILRRFEAVATVARVDSVDGALSVELHVPYLTTRKEKR